MTTIDKLAERAERFLKDCKDRGCQVVCAESCTGGLIAATLTDIAGSSSVLDCGFVTYSNESKTDLLGVAKEEVERSGAVSEKVAVAMAKGALKRSRASISVAVTGIAGPDGGSEEKPVGLVYLASATDRGDVTSVERRYGDIGRQNVRLATVSDALELIHEAALTYPVRG